VEVLSEEGSMEHEPEWQQLALLEDPKQIEDYVLYMLIPRYETLTSEQRMDIFMASLLYSHQFDGFHNVLIRNYHNSNVVEISLFNETLVEKSKKLSPTKRTGNYLYGDKLLGECNEAPKLDTTMVITPKFCVERCSFLHSVMKNNCLTLDRSITVYRGILLGGSTQYLDGSFNKKLNGFSSTSYIKQYSIGYILDVMLGPSIFGDPSTLSDVFAKIISEQLDGDNDFDFSDVFMNIRLLKITLPSGTKVFNTDVCGKGETELTLLDEGELNIISERDITPNNDTGFQNFYYDALKKYQQLKLFSFIYDSVAKTLGEDIKVIEKKIKSKEIYRDKFKIKQIDCEFVPNEVQQNYSEVLFDPLADMLA